MTSDNSPRIWVQTLVVLVTCYFGSQPANAADMKLVCLLEETVTHGQRALEIVFNERAQYVTVNGKTAIADISSARITFRVELSAGAPLDFAVDRSSGAISIVSPNSSAKSRMVYTGQCKTAAST